MLCHLKYEKIKLKKNDCDYRPIKLNKRNDSLLNRHQQLQLQSWHANCELELVVDHYVCVEYLPKFPIKGEKKALVLQEVHL